MYLTSVRSKLFILLSFLLLLPAFSSLAIAKKIPDDATPECTNQTCRHFDHLEDYKEKALWQEYYENNCDNSELLGITNMVVAAIETVSGCGLIAFSSFLSPIIGLPPLVVGLIFVLDAEGRFITLGHSNKNTVIDTYNPGYIGIDNLFIYAKAYYVDHAIPDKEASLFDELCELYGIDKVKDNKLSDSERLKIAYNYIKDNPQVSLELTERLTKDLLKDHPKEKEYFLSVINMLKKKINNNEK